MMRYGNNLCMQPIVAKLSLRGGLVKKQKIRKKRTSSWQKLWPRIII